jgi:FixJ family two-component response regulator
LDTPDTRAVSIVDDDASVRRALRNLLRSEGFRAETFESADAFLRSGHREATGCLVLDLQMPGMSGIDLLKQLTASGPRIPVIVLTAHGGDQARERSLRAGAVAFIEKPFQSEALLGAIRRALFTLARAGGAGAQESARDDRLSSRRPRVGASAPSMAVDRSPLGEPRHMCAFFNSLDEQYRVLRPFIRDGFDEGDRAVHIVDPERRDEHVKRLGDAGIDVGETMASGQLDVRLWQDTYLRGDRFDQDAMLGLVEELLQSGSAEGSSRIRLIGQMEWSLLDKPGVTDLLEYETRLNYLFLRYHQPTICAYDLTRFSASVAMDVMRAHPVVIVGGVAQENPFFVPPDLLLAEIRERQSARARASSAI